jgi:LysM repeat protein
VAVSKQELVKGVPLGLVNEQSRREVERLVQEKERLTRENRDLQQQNALLKAQLAQRAVSVSSNSPMSGVPQISVAQPAPALPELRSETLAQAATSAVREESGRGGAGKSYVVRSGDTAYAIARSYKVNVAALLSANPGVDPQRLRPGQTLAIPMR